MKPQRIQLSRRAGFRLQAVSIALNGLSAVNVARPSKWGNPHVVNFDPHGGYHPKTRAEAVDMFVLSIVTATDYVAKAKRELIGKNLACWCPLDQPCHADVLLRIANA